jgi:hypothetical protein
MGELPPLHHGAEGDSVIGVEGQPGVALAASPIHSSQSAHRIVCLVSLCYCIARSQRGVPFIVEFRSRQFCRGKVYNNWTQRCQMGPTTWPTSWPAWWVLFWPTWCSPLILAFCIIILVWYRSDLHCYLHWSSFILPFLDDLQNFPTKFPHLVFNFRERENLVFPSFAVSWTI